MQLSLFAKLYQTEYHNRLQTQTFDVHNFLATLIEDQSWARILNDSFHYLELLELLKELKNFCSKMIFSVKSQYFSKFSAKCCVHRKWK